MQVAWLSRDQQYVGRKNEEKNLELWETSSSNSLGFLLLSGKLNTIEWNDCRSQWGDRENKGMLRLTIAIETAVIKYNTSGSVVVFKYKDHM